MTNHFYIITGTSSGLGAELRISLLLFRKWGTIVEGLALGSSSFVY
ncbi:hypothetical protein SAMN03159341_1382 [Paenibacillus sp. 1_12]|nr:hypothetical protein [Paenibacillus sp. 1_12]SFM48961.1 hypothetical protein SAMN03159341_1382 [Paenibacillus sp. 1_12]